MTSPRRPPIAAHASGRTLLVAGVMSGTSGDGVDVALCRIRDRAGQPSLRILSHTHTAFPPELREAVLRAMSSRVTHSRELTRLSWRLGSFYAECIAVARDQVRAHIDLVGCHGQTVYHQGRSEQYLDTSFRCTAQIGEPSVLAEYLRCPVVNDFRAADIAAGGQGAPLVPMLDWVVLRSRCVARVLQNLGGIANLTSIPARASLDEVLAFDSGPANMVIDGLMRRLYGRELDRDGDVARTGTPSEPILRRLLEMPYFSTPPPKSCGREEFGEQFVNRLLLSCRARGLADADIVATATALSVRSVLAAYARFVAPQLRGSVVECVISGGGARNPVLMDQLRAGWRSMGAKVRPIEELGIAPEAKEAAAFALLAWLTWHGRAGNVPAATGAAHPAVLGRIAFAST